MIRQICVLVLVLVLSGAVTYGQDAAVATPSAYSVKLNNYIQSWVPVKPDTNSAHYTASSSIKEARLTTDFFDGLGRKIQTVVKQGSMISGTAAVDLVSMVAYDEWGRISRNYLPFAASTFGGNTSVDDGAFKMNPFQQQQNFYSDNNSGSPVYGQGQTYYYSKNELEPSPLERVQRSYLPGNDFVHNGKGTKYAYLTNAVGDSVKIWNIVSTGSLSSFGTYATSANYAPGELSKNITEDEDDHQTIEYKDKSGNIVLRKVQMTASRDSGAGNGHVGWLCTYYIFDDFNLLRAVIQPKGVELLQANSWNVTALSGQILAEQFYRYKYDGKRRMIMRKAPGIDSVFMVYDLRNRLILTQDGNMRNSVGWMYLQYDSLNRLIATGLWANYDGLDSQYVRAYNSISYPVVTGGPYFTELTHTFYDNYDWLGNYTTPLSSSRSTAFDSYLLTPSDGTFPYPQGLSQSGLIKGLVTGSRRLIWKPDAGVDSFLYEVNFYDDKGRLIQKEGTNMSGGIDINISQYAWNGNVLFNISKTEKAGKNAQTHVVLTKTSYDSLFRPMYLEMKIGSSLVNGGSMAATWSKVSETQYDALSKVKKTIIGNSALDSMVFDYNIQSKLLGVNRGFVKDTNNTANFFGYDLGYSDPSFVVNGLSKPYANPQYNGNVAGMNWRSAGDGKVRRFDYYYDNSNRLNAAPFTQLSNSSFDLSAGIDFSISGINYDPNGNMLSLNRRGWKGTSSATIDSLVYNYYAGSNRLMNVIDMNNDTATRLGDFRASTFYLSWVSGGAKNSSTRDYYWDKNGNMYRDFNKDIFNINFNYMNLPESYIFYNVGNVSFTYDANKSKLRKIIQRNGGMNDTTLYMGSYEYLNDTLQFIGFGNGRIRYNKDKNAFFYDYFLPDHLGSVRMVLTEEKDTARYPGVSFEDSDTASYNKYYLKGTDQRVVRPGDFYDSTSNKQTVQLLRKSVQSLGVGSLLKVMAGNLIHAKVDYYTPNVSTDNSHANGMNSLVNSLIPLINGGGISSLLKGSGAALSSNLLSSVPFINYLSNQDSSTTSTNPKAYLNIVFFDEGGNFVPQNSEAIQISVKGSGQTISRIGGSAKRAVKNGYVYIYVSNESENFVYFDNFQVTLEHGPIVNETHYYPYGLKMAGICSAALGFGAPTNKLQFSGKEMQSSEFGDMAGMESIDFGNRFYDAQTARWTSADPLTDLARRYSPFAYSFDNPLRFIDPDGMMPFAWDDIIFRDRNGEIIGRIKDKTVDKTYVVKTTRTTDDLYGMEPADLANPLRGNSNPITDEQANAVEEMITSGKTNEAIGSGLLVELPGTVESRAADKKLADKDNGLGGKADDNNREHGSTTTTDGTRKEYDGPISDPSKTGAYVDMKYPKNTAYNFHDHPSGTREDVGHVYSFNPQAPSKDDINKTVPGTTNVVVGKASRMAYIYNETGVLAIMPSKYYGNGKN